MRRWVDRSRARSRRRSRRCAGALDRLQNRVRGLSRDYLGLTTICRPTGGAGWPAAWVTFTACPAIVTFVVRALGSADESTVNVTVPEPLPLAGVIEIHETESVAVHAQLPVVVIVTVDVPPAPAIVTLVGVTE